jgi:hypothetical protein
MHLYLFDSQHVELKDLGLFGPPCTQRVVQALERLDPIPTMRLIRGKVIPEHACYRLARFRVGGKLTSEKPGGVLSRKDEYAYEPNTELFKTIICDLAETLSASPSTVIEQELLMHLAHGCIWAVGSSGTSNEQALGVDAELREFGPYLGMTKLDLGNPIQRETMIEIMFHKDIILGASGILYEAKTYMPLEDQKEDLYLAKNLGSSKPPIGLEWEEFQAALPPLSYPAVFSERGELSRQRIAGQTKVGHRERLARALLERFERSSKEEPMEFSTATEIGSRAFAFDPRKFTEYLLNKAHPKGGGKAKFFVDDLQIQPRDWRFLTDQIERGMATAPIYRVGRNEWGFTHGALVLVTGRNAKDAVLETGWIIDSGVPATFVTAYPYDDEAPQNLVAVEPFVVDPELVGDARWAAIYERAFKAGGVVAEATQPSPMVIDGYGTEWEGECGFGWVHLPNARKPMAKWLLTTEKAHRARPGVTVWSPVRTQSMARNRAWAEAFAEVLLANGIECCAKHRLD